jgi:hypothetical protein
MSLLAMRKLLICVDKMQWVFTLRIFTCDCIFQQDLVGMEFAFLVTAYHVHCSTSPLPGLERVQ